MQEVKLLRGRRVSLTTVADRDQKLQNLRTDEPAIFLISLVVRPSEPKGPFRGPFPFSESVCRDQHHRAAGLVHDPLADAAQ